MTQYLVLTDGDSDSEINLLDSNGMMPTGLGHVKIGPTHEMPSTHLRVAENFNMVMYSSDHDHAAEQLKDLVAMLRKAREYHTTTWQTTPVYLEARTKNETNTRYALVYDSPTLDFPDFYAVPFATANYLDDWVITLTRGVWQDNVPGSAPSALSLTKTSGPHDDTEVQVANHYDDNPITHIFVKNATAYTSDLSANEAFNLFPTDATSSDDALYFASTDGPFHNVIVPIGTAASGTGFNFSLRYHSTDTLTALEAGTGYTLYPAGPASNLFNTSDVWAININPPDSWSAVTLDSDVLDTDAYWLEVLVSASSTDWTTPVTTTDLPYIQNLPYIEFDSDVLEGDIPPFLQIRHFAPYGQTDTDAAMGAISRIIMGARSDPGSFNSHLNAGGVALPSTDWAASYDTDTFGNVATNIDTTAPGGYHAHCSFTSLATMQPRVQFLGDNLLADYMGEYRAFMRCEQVGGTDADISTQLRVQIGSTDSYAPRYDTEEKYLETYDNGWEVVDFGKVSIPFAEVTDTDVLTADIVFTIMAERNQGTSTFKVADLILIPIDEWSITLDDPITDNDVGSSALRGNTALDLDTGILGNRTQKYIKVGGSWIPAENWYRHGRPWAVEPNKKVRLYYLMMHYDADKGWGNAPLMSSLGMGMGVEARSRGLYLALRGSD